MEREDLEYQGFCKKKDGFLKGNEGKAGLRAANLPSRLRRLDPAWEFRIHRGRGSGKDHRREKDY